MNRFPGSEEYSDPYFCLEKYEPQPVAGFAGQAGGLCVEVRANVTAVAEAGEGTATPAKSCVEAQVQF